MKLFRKNYIDKRVNSTTYIIEYKFGLFRGIYDVKLYEFEPESEHDKEMNEIHNEIITPARTSVIISLTTLIVVILNYQMSKKN